MRRPNLSDSLNGLLQEDRFGKYIKQDQRSRLQKILNTTGEKSRAPKRIGLYIKDCSEKALQRAVYLSAYTELFNGKKKICWGDAEVPISPKGILPRGSCFDLVGREKTDNQATHLLCELKAGKTNDSPLFAAFELLTYYAVFQKYNEFCYHTNSTASISKWNNKAGNNSVMLIVAGDSLYWEKWNSSWNSLPFQPLQELGETIYFFEIPINSKTWFSMQKNNQARYTPCLGQAYQWKQLYPK